MTTQDESDYETYVELRRERERKIERRHDLWRENWGI